jgi:hypothetical protein
MRTVKLEKKEGAFGRIGRAVRNVARRVEGKTILGRPATAQEIADAARSTCGTCHGRGHYRVIMRPNYGTRMLEGPNGPVPMMVREPGFHSVPVELCGCALKRFPRVHKGRVETDMVGTIHWISGQTPEDRTRADRMTSRRIRVAAHG